MAVKYYSGNRLTGTASDRSGFTTTNLLAGSTFIETDTHDMFHWNGSAWNVIASDTVAQTLTSKTLTTPTIAATGWANATHTHSAANRGGQFAISNTTGTLAVARGGTGATTLDNLITLGDHTTGNYIATIAGTANEIEVTGSGSEGGAVTIGIPTNPTLGGNVTVSGNLTVSGTTTTVSSTEIVVADPIVSLATTNTGNAVDIGFYGKYVSSGTKYTGLLWDANVSKYRLFHGNATEPTTTVDIAGTGHSTSTLLANLEGNVTGNADTATALETARTIGGVSFNGTANITLPGVNASGTQDTSGTAAVATTVTLNGSGNVTYYPTFVDATSGNENIRVDSDWTYNASSNKMTVGNIGIPDNGVLEFGASQDLKIYHDVNNSYIKEEGAGSLLIWSTGTEVKFLGGTGAGTMVDMNTGGSVDLYHNDVKKFETTAAGIAVSGSATVTHNSNYVSIAEHASSDVLEMKLVGAADHDTALYFGDANDAVEAGFWWDTSEATLKFQGHNNSTRMVIDNVGKVGIGTTDPDYDFEVETAGAEIFAHYAGHSRGGLKALSTQRLSLITTSSADDFVFGYSTDTTPADDGSDFVERMRIDNGTGYMGVGTTAPIAKTHLYAAATTGTVPYPLLSLELSDDGADTAIGEGPAINFYIPDTTTDSTGSGTIYARKGAGNSHLAGQIATVRISATDALGSGDITFSTAENAGALTERMRIRHNGNVGIGTDITPDYLLDVQGTFRADGAASFGSTINAGVVTVNGLLPSANNTYDLAATGTRFRDAFFNRYVYAAYVNVTANVVTSGLTHMFVEANSDRWTRLATAATVRSFLGLTTMDTGESNSTIVQRNSSGYVFAGYFNASGSFNTTGASSGIDNFIGTNGTDTYARSYTTGAVRTQISYTPNVVAASNTTNADQYMAFLDNADTNAQELKYVAAATVNPSLQHMKVGHLGFGKDTNHTDYAGLWHTALTRSSLNYNLLFHSGGSIHVNTTGTGYLKVLNSTTAYWDATHFSIEADHFIEPQDVDGTTWMRPPGGHWTFSTYTGNDENGTSRDQNLAIQTWSARHVKINKMIAYQPFTAFKSQGTVGTNNAEGAELVFARGVDDANFWHMDVYGTGNTPSLRFHNSGSVRFNLSSTGNITSTGASHTFYSGGSTVDMRIGRNSSEHLQIHVDDMNAFLDHENDSDSNGNHNFYIRNVAAGTGTNSITLATTYNGTTKEAMWIKGSSGAAHVTVTELSKRFGNTEAAAIDSGVESYPLGHHGLGEEVFSIDPTWSDKELQEYFGNANVAWVEDAQAPNGWAIEITGGVSTHSHNGAGFPLIPIYGSDDEFFMECWIANSVSSSTNRHYMGSIDFKEGFAQPSGGWGNPGSYGYWVMLNTGITVTSYLHQTGYIGGYGTATGDFETGSKFWSPQALFNYSNAGGTRTCRISGWRAVRVYQPGNRKFGGSITATGDITAYSDERLKSNIVPINNALDKVASMKGVSFNRLDTGKAGVGVLAQELERIAPELVHDGKQYKSVAYGNLTAYLVEAIKELKAEVELLRRPTR